MRGKGFAAAVVIIASLLLYLYAGGNAKTKIPVEKVFAHVQAATEAPRATAVFRQQREEQRQAEMAALKDAPERLARLVARAEAELAIEGALAAMSLKDAVCAVRDGAVTVCVSERLNDQQVQAIAQTAAQLADISLENVFILDECGYL